MVTHKGQIMFAVAAALVMVGTASGQVIQGVRREAAKPVIGGTDSIDSQLAACLISDNEGEVTLGELAQQKAKGKEVREFAEEMTEDHGALLKQLDALPVRERKKIVTVLAAARTPFRVSLGNR